MNTSHTPTSLPTNEDGYVVLDRIPGVHFPTAEQNMHMTFQRRRFSLDYNPSKEHLLNHAGPTERDYFANFVTEAHFKAMAMMSGYELRKHFKDLAIRTH